MRTPVEREVDPSTIGEEETICNNSGRSEMSESRFPRLGGSMSEDFEKELLAWTPSAYVYEPLDDSLGSWKHLANWYWDYWKEIESQLTTPCLDDQIPPRPLRDSLVVLYFKHIHPVCPIFDEVEFHKYYSCDDDDSSFLKAVSLLEFQAMMFAASLHLNDQQIRTTNYSSTYQCHGSLFKIAKATYHASKDESPIILTRAAILLSYWSPYNSEEQTNSYWVDQAFKNAFAARLHKQRYDSPSTTRGRRKLIWWSCLVRDRLVALGLRRFHLLHKSVPNCSLPSEEDFGTEAQYPQFLDKSGKHQHIINFIAQCELSQVMARISRFQEQRIYTANSPASEGSSRDSELKEVTSFHIELDKCSERFEMALKQLSDSVIESYNMPCQMTRIYYSSVVAMLYLPYTSLSSSPSCIADDRFSESALQNVKEAASRIAKSTEVLAYDADSNHIPLAIGAWITFPIAVKMVFLRNPTSLEDPAAEIQEMRVLMNLLHLLKSRFNGGQFIADILSAIISQVFLDGSKNDVYEISNLLQEVSDMIDKGLANGIIPSAKL